MKRWQLLELHEAAWFPRPWRDLLTDFMSFFARRFRPYAAIADKLHAGMVRCGDEAILDLCSGAAEPVLTVQEELARQGVEVAVTVTDLYPNEQVFARLETSRRETVRCVHESIDALRVPAELPGFRTFFSAFHHFRPEQAVTVFRGVVAQRQGVGVFEYTERNLLRWGPAVLLMPVLVWIATPLIQPRTAARFVWTYLFPVVPLVAAWDALVSVLRSYHPEELLAVARTIDNGDYRWEAGRVAAFGGCRVTYLLGVPARTAPGETSRPPAASPCPPTAPAG